MDKNQTSQGTHAGVLSATNPQLSRARILLLALLLAFSLASLQPGVSIQAAADRTASANEAGLRSHQSGSLQPNCQACQQALVACLANGGGSACDIEFDFCIATCH